MPQIVFLDTYTRDWHKTKKQKQKQQLCSGHFDRIRLSRCTSHPLLPPGGWPLGTALATPLALASRWVQPMGSNGRSLESSEERSGHFLPLLPPCWVVVGNGYLPPPKPQLLGSLQDLFFTPGGLGMVPVSHYCQPWGLTLPSWFPSTQPIPFVNILFIKPSTLLLPFEGALCFLLGFWVIFKKAICKSKTDFFKKIENLSDT